MLHQRALASSHYTLLGVHPSASMREIRQAYRDLSKLYHPDTTSLPAAIATAKFQQLNEAYATLSSPERRVAYDKKIRYSRVAVAQPLPNLTQAAPTREYKSSAYLDPTDRPLSPGEVFALFILGLTFVACLVLAIMIGVTRGEAVFQPMAAQIDVVQSAPTFDPTQLGSPPEAHNRPANVTDAIVNKAIPHDSPTSSPTDLPIDPLAVPLSTASTASPDAAPVPEPSTNKLHTDLPNSSEDLHDTSLR